MSLNKGHPSAITMTYFKPDYVRYIRSDAWKYKCELYWLKYGRWCKACKKTDRLHVHHMTYDHFKREPLTDLVGLCYACHREVHRLHRAGGRRVDLRTITLEFIRTKQLVKARRK